MESIGITEFDALKAKDKDLLVLDVREKWEFEEVNIGASNIPLCTLPEKLSELAPYKETQIVCHCKTGKRSRQAAKYLKKNGFRAVLSLEGGIQAYISQYSVVQD